MTTTLSNDGEESVFGAVLDRAVAGDQEAVAELLAEFEPGLLRFATSRGVTDPEAVVNRALSDAFTSLGRFRGRDRRAFRAYLYQILRRRITDQYRRAYTQPKTVSGLDDDLVSDLVDRDASDFDERLADQALVEEILDQLTEEQREVLEMRVLTGLSIKETATMTGRSEGAVKSMQRRALSSLRSVVIAIAVIALAALAVRALISAGQNVVVVENSPADGPANLFEDTEEGQRAVLEAEVPERPGGEPDDQGVGPGGEPDTAPVEQDGPMPVEATDDEPAPPSDATQEPEAEVRADAEVEARTDAGGEQAVVPDELANVDDQGPAAEVPAVRPEPEIVVEPIPSAPCSVMTDGTPARGEVAFVTYQFTGPYELFKGASVDIIGSSGKSGLIRGKASADRVWNGTRLPFVISGNMLGDDGFTVRTYLGGREVKATCEISDQVMRAPCVVDTRGEPARGDDATVRYRLSSPYGQLEGKATYIIGKEGVSAYKDGGEAAFRSKVTRDFAIDGSMFPGGQFTVRTAFAGGQGHAVCEIR